MSNLIDRQAATQTALDFIVEYLGGAFDEDLQKELIERMNALPAAQPEIIMCEDCTYWHDSGKCDYFSIPERRIEVHMDKDGFCSDAERRTDE